MRLLLVGATGLVGGHVLAQALADARVAAIVAPTRRALAAHDKLHNPVVDFEQLPADADWWRADALVCTLGTTIKAAGSQAAFRRVDHDYPLAVARLAHRRGTPTCVLNSATGANAGSRIFYNRVKGEVEQALAEVGFASLTLVRPGLIGGQRQESRPAERVGQIVLGALGPVLPRGWRINPAPRIAQAMLAAALSAPPGRHVVGASALV
ncbi:MAG: NAD-dependent dehydratase [Pseudomonadota bacterium]|nr:NAD-dependent dehydratase [Pseudomonadota bacterium]